MSKKVQQIGWIVLMGLLLIGLMHCQKDGNDALTTPGAATDQGSYSQNPGTSSVVNVFGDEYQLNLAVGNNGGSPFGEWLYVEINEQSGRGKAPGVDQVEINLGSIVFQFSELPGDVTAIVAGVPTSSTAQEFRELGSYPAANGAVSIPVETGDLAAIFGPTHFSVWFKTVGGANGIGVQGGKLTLTGTLPDGQTLGVSQTLSFGTAPAATPTPTSTTPTTPTTPTLSWHLGGVNQNCNDVCAGYGLTCNLSETIKVGSGDTDVAAGTYTHTGQNCTSTLLQLTTIDSDGGIADADDAVARAPLGCYVNPSDGDWRWGMDSSNTAATTCEGAASDAQRVCACN